MISRRFFLAALILALSCALPLAAQEEPGARLIAVFPYGDSGGFLRKEDAFARYAIPDMIRLNIAKQGRFDAAPKAAVDKALADSGADAEGEASQEGMRAAAIALGADHYVWGYIGSLGDGIGVFHRIVETESGRTVHESFGRLPAGEGIFDAIERSVGEFSAWINADLPVRGPDIVYVEKEVIVEKPAGPPPESDPGRGLGIGVDVSYRFFAFQFASWIRPAPRAGLELDLAENRRGARLGFIIESSPLFQASGGLMVLGGVTVLQTSLFARLCFSLPITAGLEARLAAMAGASFFAGYVSPQPIAYLRPSFAIAACLQYRPLHRLAIGLEARAEITPYAWGSSHMIDFAPVLALRFFP
jgi:hypothetical protein